MQPSKFTIPVLLSSVILLAVGLSSCQKGDTGTQGPAGANGSAGPVLSGNLFGFVNLFDQYGGQFHINLDSVMVTVSGNSLNDTAYTDTTGRYQFNNLTTGVYNMTFSKPGFGGVKPVAMQFTGGGTLARAAVSMSAYPTFNVIGMRDSVNTTAAYITDSVAVVNTTQIRSVVLYVGASSAVDSISYLGEYTMNIGIKLTSYSTQFVIPYSDFTDMGFTSGQTVYFLTYGLNTNYSSASSYVDYTTNRTIFTALSSTPDTLSIVLP